MHRARAARPRAFDSLPLAIRTPRGVRILSWASADFYVEFEDIGRDTGVHTDKGYMH
jgi:hypothetical protein